MGPGVQVVSRDTVIKGAFGAGPSSVVGSAADFDVTRDGQRIVTAIPLSDSYQLVVVPNWLTEFRQRMAGSKR